MSAPLHSLHPTSLPSLLLRRRRRWEPFRTLSRHWLSRPTRNGRRRTGSRGTILAKGQADDRNPAAVLQQHGSPFQGESDGGPSRPGLLFDLGEGAGLPSDTARPLVLPPRFLGA